MSWFWRPDLTQEILQDGIAAAVPVLADLTQQPAAGQVGKGGQALAQVALEGRDLGRPGFTRAVGRRLEAALDVFAHGLAVDPDPPGDGGDAQALSVQFQDHDNLPKPDHHHSPRTIRGMVGIRWKLVPVKPAQARAGSSNWGIFSRHFWGELSRHRQC
jgi:hypothetical protein